MDGLERILGLVRRIWPAEEQLSPAQRYALAVDIATGAVALPFAAAGLAWLVSVSVTALAAANLPAVLLLAALVPLFSQLHYFVITEIGRGRFTDMSSSLEDSVLWAGVWIAGPLMMWIGLFLTVLSLGRELVASRSVLRAANRFRNILINTINLTLCAALGLAVYRLLGGTLPLPGLDLRSILAAAVALGVQFTASILVWLLFLSTMRRVQLRLLPEEKDFQGSWQRFILLALGLPGLSLPFSILAAGVYAAEGFVALLFVMGGLLLSALVLNRFSQAAEHSRRQHQQISRLQQLGRDLLASSPEQTDLAGLLAEHVPSMFSHANIEIRLFPDEILLRHPAEFAGPPPAALDWLGNHTEGTEFHPGKNPGWPKPNEAGCVLVPILDLEGKTAVGGIYLGRSSWAPAGISHSDDTLSVLQSLSSEITAVRRRYETYQQTLTYQKTMREMEIAGQIQQSLLPEEIPAPAGWQISAELRSVGQASGDFYDLFTLPSGRLALVIADVSDKGMGAALYMILSRTLLRTYALETECPADILKGVNQRLLQDSRSEQYVTVFAAVLDPMSGDLLYANAGHNPPLVFAPGHPGPLASLVRTGIPLGIYADQAWGEEHLTLQKGQVLVCYTDGVPDAQNAAGEFLGMECLEQAVGANRNATAEKIKAAILEAVQQHTHPAPQFDDITLMVLKRTRS